MNNICLPTELETKELTLEDIVKLSDTVWKTQPEWYYKAAYDAMVHNQYEIIKGRCDNYVYLVRMWLREPQPNKDSKGYESGNEAMLHWFARPDDDNCLHCHPWAFTTSLLCGNYDEYLPTQNWLDGDRILGPKWDEHFIARKAGDTASHAATDLHCVGRVQRGTMTLMRTGHRERVWGFHQEGVVWKPFYEHLGLTRENCLLNNKKMA